MYINKGLIDLNTDTVQLLRAAAFFAVLGATAASYAGTLSAKVTTPGGEPLPMAVVTATAAGVAPSSAKPGSKAVMVQTAKQFMPFVLPVQMGTSVEFPNRDPFRHQVYSFSPAKTFELKLYGGSEAGAVTFDKEGVVPLGCNIHDNMLAYVYVVGTPYFAVTAQLGEGKITELPAGDYTVKVWHPNQKSSEGNTGTVRIAESGESTITVQMELKRGRTQRKPGAIDENEY
jgi:plastocyanin